MVFVKLSLKRSDTFISFVISVNFVSDDVLLFVSADDREILNV